MGGIAPPPALVGVGDERIEQVNVDPHVTSITKELREESDVR